MDTTKRFCKALVVISISSVLLSCGGDDNKNELQCSYFLFVNESQAHPMSVHSYLPGDEEAHNVWINSDAYYYYPELKCEVDRYPEPEDVFEKIEMFTENSQGQTLMYAGVSNVDWVYEAYVFGGESVRRYSIGFNEEGLTQVTKNIQ